MADKGRGGRVSNKEGVTPLVPDKSKRDRLGKKERN
jgi:hypothetical protein